LRRQGTAGVSHPSVKNSIRIGSGAGYAGDRVEPAIDLIRHGELDYIVFECLAERTISLAQQEKLSNPNGGYNNLLPYRMKRVLPELRGRNVRIISNMGAANPIGAGRKICELAEAAGHSDFRIAAVTGDDVTHKLDQFLDLRTIETGVPLREFHDRIISANAYTGATKIAEALDNGADIVVTGRTADPALAIGPIMFEFRRSYDDFDFLGKATLAGHLLECGSQVMGGYFADPGYKDVPNLWNIGFPIAEFSESGEIRVTKLPEAGGALTEASVKEQLLYEIQDPAAYLTPDVVADFSRTQVDAHADGSVTISNATGHPKTGMLKVNVGYRDGYIGEGEISYGGAGALARARLAGEVIRKRFDCVGLELQELRIDFIGVNSLFGDAGGFKDHTDESNSAYRDVRLRVAGRAQTELDAKIIGQEVEALYTNGPAGGGGARATVRPVVAITSILIPEDEVQEEVTYFDV